MHLRSFYSEHYGGKLFSNHKKETIESSQLLCIDLFGTADQLELTYRRSKVHHPHGLPRRIRCVFLIRSVSQERRHTTIVITIIITGGTLWRDCFNRMSLRAGLWTLPFWACRASTVSYSTPSTWRFIGRLARIVFPGAFTWLTGCTPMRWW